MLHVPCTVPPTTPPRTIKQANWKETSISWPRETKQSVHTNPFSAVRYFNTGNVRASDRNNFNNCPTIFCKKSVFSKSASDEYNVQFSSV